MMGRTLKIAAVVAWILSALVALGWADTRFAAALLPAGLALWLLGEL